LRAVLALILCSMFLVSNFSVIPLSGAREEDGTLTTTSNAYITENLPENARPFYRGVIGSWATERLLEPLLNLWALLENQNATTEALEQAVQSLDNTAKEVFLEVNENVENYRRLAAENLVPEEDVDYFAEFMENLKLKVDNLISQCRTLLELIERDGDTSAKSKEILSLLDRLLANDSVELEGYGFYTYVWWFLVPVTDGYRNKTYYFWFKLKNTSGFWGASWDGNFSIRVNHGIGRGYYDGSIPAGGTYEDWIPFTPETLGSKPWSLEITWESGWLIWYESGTIERSGSFNVVNRPPVLSGGEPSPSSGPWGTKFTYSLNVSDYDGDTVTVTFYRDGREVGSQTVYGSGTATWT